ncbi:alpha/beta hydrolase [Halobacteriovorax sp.]|uniref:alpha/beta hydrolase n=1 Tax=Halobacteriovorax sp. TaxID=2020862 RepID=UPI003AF2B8E3
MKSSIYIREYYATTEPRNNKSKKNIILFHDIGGGHYTFENLIPLMNDEGINVVTFDYLGHGLSSGTRGHFESIEQIKGFLTELHTSSQIAQSEEVYTLSINQGALVALYYATLFENVAGNIFINPRLRVELDKKFSTDLFKSIPLPISKLQLNLRKQSSDLTANGFITKKSLITLNKLLKKVQLDIYFMKCRNLIFSSDRNSIIFETLMSEFHDEVEVPEMNSIKMIKKQDIIFKETYNWLYEN